MIEILQAIQPWAQTSLQAAFIVFLRVGAVLATFPLFGEQNVPQRVRLALALCFVMVVFPAVSPELQLVNLSWRSRPFLASEVIIGLGIGALFRIYFLCLSIAGSIAAQSTSLSQLFGGTAGEPQPTFGHILTLAGLGLAFAMDLHARAAQLLILSYEVFPAGRFPAAGPFLDWGLQFIGRAFGFAVALAIPFVVVSLAYNLILGVINRAMPQLMVAMVGAPAITGAAIYLLWLTGPQLLTLWSGGFIDEMAAFGGWR